MIHFYMTMALLLCYNGVHVGNGQALAFIMKGVEHMYQHHVRAEMLQMFILLNFE